VTRTMPGGTLPFLSRTLTGGGAAGAASMMERMGAGLTLTMTRVGPDQTRVKIRFDNVYSPLTIQELYKRVWDALDKQIFLDKSVG